MIFSVTVNFLYQDDLALAQIFNSIIFQGVMDSDFWGGVGPVTGTAKWNYKS